MTKKEFANIFLTLSKTYDWFDATDDAKLGIWYNFFEGDDYRLTLAAVQAFISISDRPPTVAGIRAKMVDIQTPVVMLTAGEAWQEVVGVISRYGYYAEREALESLSLMVRKATKAMGFRQLCMSENQIADRARFFQTYNSMVEREKNVAVIPMAVRKRIAEIMNGSKQITGGNNE